MSVQLAYQKFPPKFHRRQMDEDLACEILAVMKNTDHRDWVLIEVNTYCIFDALYSFDVLRLRDCPECEECYPTSTQRFGSQADALGHLSYRYKNPRQLLCIPDFITQTTYNPCGEELYFKSDEPGYLIVRPFFE